MWNCFPRALNRLQNTPYEDIRNQKREEEQDSDLGGDIQFQHPQRRTTDSSYHNGAASFRGGGMGANSTPLNNRQPGNPWSQDQNYRENQHYSATQEPPRGRSRKNEPPGGSDSLLISADGKQPHALRADVIDTETDSAKLKTKPKSISIYNSRIPMQVPVLT